MLGVIHKATEGTTFIDDARAENLANAQKAGLAIATYFWLKPGDGASQAEFYLQTIDPVQGERVVIDYEEDGCSLTTLKDAVQALLDYRYGLQITVYSGHLLKEQLGDRADAYLAANTDLWLAQYADEGSISWPEGTYPAWSLWQYSESGEIPGIDDGYADLDRYNGNDRPDDARYRCRPGHRSWRAPTKNRPRSMKPVNEARIPSRASAREEITPKPRNQFPTAEGRSDLA